MKIKTNKRIFYFYEIKRSKICLKITHTTVVIKQKRNIQNIHQPLPTHLDLILMKGIIRKLTNKFQKLTIFSRIEFIYSFSLNNVEYLIRGPYRQKNHCFSSLFYYCLLPPKDQLGHHYFCYSF